ncbi:MAG: hypothetical protein QM723_30160 [Myxococcaceae bacterium]
MKGRNLAGSVALLLVLLIGGAVRILRYQHPKADPRWYTLGSLAREFATEKQSFDEVIDKLGGDFVLPESAKTAMRQAFKLADWEALDQQPQLDLKTLGMGLEQLAARRALKLPTPPQRHTEVLGTPQPKALTGEPYQQQLPFELLYGDTLDVAKAKHAGESEWLAAKLEAVAMGATLTDGDDAGAVGASNVEQLYDLLAAKGIVLEVSDERLFANFGDLIRRGKPVATPLWVATQHALDGNMVYLPVPHAQLEIHAAGPGFEAFVTFYPSLDLAGTGDGGVKFRADVTSDQSWCGHRVAHVYPGAQAREALRWMGLLRLEWDAKVFDNKLPLDGYYALGVCTLAPAVVERALTGTTTLWPLTHDPKYFQGSGPIDQLVAQLPSDTHSGKPPEEARLVGSLPFSREDEVTLVGLRQTVKKLHWLEAKPK